LSLLIILAAISSFFIFLLFCRFDFDLLSLLFLLSFEFFFDFEQL